MRPSRNERPVNRCLCMTCGAAWEIRADDEDQGAAFRVFLAEHRLCRILGIASAECVVLGCESTGIGPSQKCPQHGGAFKARDLRAEHGK